MYSLDRLTHYLYRSRTSGLAALELNYFISQFAAGMVGTFGVLFIYQLGDSLKQGLLFIVLFFGLQRLVVGLSVPLVGFLYTRLGYRWMMMTGIVCLIVKLWLLTRVALLTSVGVNPLQAPVVGLLIGAVVLGGLTISGYYLGFHALFLDDNDDFRVGEQIASLAMLSRWATVVSPLLAGLLIDRFGFPFIFLLGVGLLVVSILPLFAMPRHDRHRGRYSWVEVLKTIGQEGRVTGSIISWHIENGIQAFFWPVYLFLVLGSYTSFGAVSSMVMAVSGLAVYGSGRIYDQRPLRGAFPAAAALASVTWLLRFLSVTPLSAATAHGLTHLLSPVWWMKIRREELLVGESRDSLVFGAFHELLVTLGYLTSLMVGYLILVVTGFSWIWLLLPAVVGIGVSTWLVSRS